MEIFNANHDICIEKVEFHKNFENSKKKKKKVYGKVQT